MPTTSAKTVGERLRAAADRLRKPRPYTDEDRARLFAPITIRSFGGKSWGGAFPANRDVAIERRSTGDRYGYVADHRDLDAL